MISDTRNRMKLQPVSSMLFVTLVLSFTLHVDAIALRAGNATATGVAKKKLTGLLCREPEAKGGGDDVDVILEEDGRRSLLFSRNVKDSKGQVIGREVAGMQSTVHCATDVSSDSKCLPADLSKPVPTCTEVGQKGQCRCTATVNEPLKLPYQAAMIEETLKICEAKGQGKQTFRVLMFGLGGGAMPMYLHHRCASAHIETVESDARVALIAQRLFGFKADSNNRVEIADGEEAAERHAKTKPWPEGEKYDIVLVDCFDAKNQVAPSCRSESFIHSIRAVLAPEGRVMHNVLDTDMKQLLPMYQATFGASETVKQAVQNGQFLIVATTGANHPRA